MKPLFEAWRRFITEIKEFVCPSAIEDPVLNNWNRQEAIWLAKYGPPNPNKPNNKFWLSYAEKWNTTIEDVKTMRCRNCRFFDVSRAIQDCIEQGIEDEYEQWDAGGFGYCHKWDFMCREERTCLSWASGGPYEGEEDETAT